MYKDLEEDTIGEKIIKLRKVHNLNQKEFAKIIGHHFDTVLHWETHDVMPKPESIKNICDKFDLPLKYFHEYYYFYFNDPGERIRRWKEKRKYTYSKCCKFLGVSDCTLKKLVSRRIGLSYEMYLRLKDNGVF
jgi:transcriptional regulator with XRE-family HTH domain